MAEVLFHLTGAEPVAALIDVSDTEWRFRQLLQFLSCQAALIDVSDTEWRLKPVQKKAPRGAALIDVSDTEWRHGGNIPQLRLDGAALIDVSDTEWRNQSLRRHHTLHSSSTH